MKLNIQLYSLGFSFLYGGIFYFLLDLFNNFNKKNKIILSILSSLIFVIFCSLSYFICLLYINKGYLHVYFLVFILVGYLFVSFIMKFWFTHRKK